MCPGPFPVFRYLKSNRKMTYYHNGRVKKGLKKLFLLLFSFFCLISCEQNGILISLTGEWEYRKGFHSSWLKGDTLSHWEKIKVPFYLQSIPELKYFEGRITLRKQLPAEIIDSLQKGEHIVFRSGGIPTAADFYMGTELLGSLQSTGPCKADTSPEFSTSLRIPGSPGSYTLSIVLHITGMNRRPCLIGQNIEAGSSDSIYSRIYGRSIITLLFICFSLLLGIYYILIGIRITAKKYYLYFGVYCLFSSVYYFLYYPAEQFIFLSDSFLQYRLIHCIMFLTGPIFLFFIHNLYKRRFPLVLKIWTGISISLTLITPAARYFIINIFYQYWTISWIVLLIYILALIMQEMTRNNIEAILMVTGIVILIFSLIYDLLINLGFFTNPPIGLITSFITISIFSLAIINRFVRIYKKVESLNVELEKRIKERTEKLETAQTKLIDTAHKAGMAEVATTILHNMKNILNSMSISCEEIIDTIKDSKLPGLLKANVLLKEHKDNIATYLSSDKKGLLMLEYYLTVSEFLVDEQEKVNLETKQVEKNIQMIKRIIDTQQEYAKRELVDNELNLEETIEEALRIQSKEFSLNHVKIRKHYLKIHYIKGQKSSVIQIFLNLFKNACTALQQNEQDNRVLTIETGKEKEKMVYVRICDNGIGIPGEDLDKVFHFGFTRQEDGHGFGLHACADIINSMGGTITVASGGPGHGAEFTLFFQHLNQKRR
jgi:signal transduction histidine kinase